jgi:serine/threonine-protein kinase
VLYELVTGTRPFEGSPVVVMGKQLREEPERPRVRAPTVPIPGELEAVIAKALALEPDERYQSAAELAAAVVRVAVMYGWSTSRPVIARLMRGLFGEVPEPWTVAARAEPTAPMAPLPAVAAVVALPSPGPTRIITRPRRMPRGTEADVAAPVDADEDAPTRGRRSLPSIWRRELAA